MLVIWKDHREPQSKRKSIGRTRLNLRDSVYTHTPYMAPVQYTSPMKKETGNIIEKFSSPMQALAGTFYLSQDLQER